MARTKVGQENPVNMGATSFYETMAFTEEGDAVRVRVPIMANPDRTVPQTDADGKVPEFVNVSGTLFQLCVENQPNDTIRVPPFGIVKGAQWRSKSEPSRAWGQFPPFIERVPRKGGTDKNGRPIWEYDEDYLLTEEQVLEQAKKLKSPEFARKRLRMYMMYAKPQTFDASGFPEKTEEELQEDRPRVSSALMKRIDDHQRRWDVIYAEMTGQVKPRAIRPGTPTT